MNVAVVGATGLVGRTIIELLESIPEIDLLPLASPKSAGHELKFKDKTLKVKALTPNISADFCLLSAGSDVSKDIVPKFAKKGIVCIDNSSQFRQVDKIPLVVSGVNEKAIKKSKIIANPNCSTIQTVKVLHEIQKKVPLKWVHYVTYQSVSGMGQKGVEILLSEKHKDKNSRFAGKVVPFISDLTEVSKNNFRFKEEEKMILETQKIMDLDIPVDASCYRVPTLYCHGVYTHFGVGKNIEVSALKKAIEQKDDLRVHEENDFVYNSEVAGTDLVHVMKLRKSFAPPKSFSYFCLADNLRVGAATNAVDILKYLLKNR